MLLHILVLLLAYRLSVLKKAKEERRNSRVVSIGCDVWVRRISGVLTRMYLTGEG